MKKNRVQKLGLLLLVALYVCPAISQDSTDYTLNNIKKYATRMDESFSTLRNRAGDERNTWLKAAERLKTFCDSIEEEMEYLPDDYYFRLSPLVSGYRADIDEYGKLVVNDDFEGKDKLLAAAFSSLQQQQASFRQAVVSAYEHAVSQNASWGNLPTGAEEQNTQVAAQPQAPNDNSVAPGNDHAAEHFAGANENGASKNAILLDTLHAALQQIERAIHLTEQAAEQNDVSTIRLHTTRIADASLKISGLSLLLDAKGKENLYLLAASLRHAAENLRTLAKKGTPPRSEMRDSISEMKIKFSSLSTGISFVK